jgi:hypothetical protein
VTAKTISGSISGKVINPDNMPMAYAIQGPDTINCAQIEMADSTFVLSFLPEGRYTVSVRDNINRFYNQDDVLVTAGINIDIGSIALYPIR